jgi:hypothetical protein
VFKAKSVRNVKFVFKLHHRRPTVCAAGGTAVSQESPILTIPPSSDMLALCEFAVASVPRLEPIRDDDSKASAFRSI